MKTKILFVAVLCAGYSAIAQSDTTAAKPANARFRLELPSLPDLQQSIHQHYQQQLAAELAEFAEMRKGDWMKYLPNVGTTYTLARGSASGRSLWPTVSFNINMIYQARRDKQTREAKRRSIEQKIRLEERKTLAAVQTMVTEYHIRLRELETQKLILETDRVRRSRYSEGVPVCAKARRRRRTGSCMRFKKTSTSDRKFLLRITCRRISGGCRCSWGFGSWRMR